MKSFRFELQAVLTLREREDRLALENYAKTLALQAQAKARMEEAERDLLAHYADGRRLAGIPSSASELARSQARRVFLAKEVELQAEKVREAQKIVNQARVRAVAAHQALEGVEKLFQKRRLEYEARVAGDERKMIDDLVGARRLPEFSSGTGYGKF